MFTIFIENRPYIVKEGQNLLQACLSLGFNIPYFCWHPAMHSVGACRQCAVKEFKDEKDTRGRIVMSCMTGVRDGMRISIEDAEAKSFRKNIVELLMLNHPHDCPVCDEGGECHLQDMTVMTGHVYRRSRFKKRTYTNQYLGPFVAHEMNRCIQCYRCVRYYRDYAGGRDLDVFGIHDAVYFGRQKDGVLENGFSGNLVEICPTGVFTDKTFQRRYTRKWDLQTAPSICVLCGVGCNTIPGERYGELRRIRCRYNGEVNRYFLCDRGRFGYEFVNSDQRIREPRVREPLSPSTEKQKLRTATREEALGFFKEIIAGSKGLIGIGSPRASLEANFALRTLVGADNFYSGMSEREAGLVTLIIDILQNGPARTPSLREIETCDAVFILGEDVTNTAPVLALALRQAARQKSLETAAKGRIPLWDDAAVRNATQGTRGRLSIASPYPTKLDDAASRLVHGTPDDIARFGFAVAHELNSEFPAVTGLKEPERRFAEAIAAELRNAKRPLVVSGTGCGSDVVIQAAANVATALAGPGRSPGLCYAVPECNTLGVAMMNAGSIARAFHAVQEGKADTLIVLENDLYRRADESAVNDFFSRVKHLIALDQLESRTTGKAACVLPSATFAETDGTLVNLEGRAQRFYQVFVPKGGIQESWRWLRDMMTAAGHAGGREWEGLDDVITALAVTLPLFSAVPDIAPPAAFRIAGMKIPRQSHRYSGRTAMHADSTVFEPRPPKDPDSPLAFSMEGYHGRPPSALIPRFWAPEWNSPQAMNKFQSEVGGPLQGGDPGRRLIEPQQTAGIAYFKKVPSAFVPRAEALFFVPVHHIHGSEDRSLLAPWIAELAARPYVGLDLKRMQDRNLTEGEEVVIKVNNGTFIVPVKQMSGLPEGSAALFGGLLRTADLPAWGTLSKTTERPG